MQLATDAIVGERFRVEEKLFADAFGEVFRAADIRDGGSVHVRALAADRCVAPGSTSLVLAIARDRAAARHPNLAALVDLVVHHDRWYLVAEVWEGDSLATHVQSDGVLDEVTASHLVADVAEAVAALHDAGVVHGHLDPARIFLDGTLARLTDVGLGTLIGDESEEWRTTIRDLNDPSVGFLSPEQARGEGAPTAKSDVWALGAILHFLVTGASPYAATTRAARASAVRAAVPKQLSRELAAMLDRALADEPRERPTARELAEVLRARRVSRWPAVAAVVVASLVLGFGLSFVARPKVGPPLGTIAPETQVEDSREPYSVSTAATVVPAPAAAQPPPTKLPPPRKRPARDPFYGVTSAGF